MVRVTVWPHLESAPKKPPQSQTPIATTMAYLNRMRRPTTPTDSRVLPWPSGSAMLCPLPKARQKQRSTNRAPTSPFQAIDWLSFAPPRWLPIPRHLHVAFSVGDMLYYFNCWISYTYLVDITYQYS